MIAEVLKVPKLYYVSAVCSHMYNISYMFYTRLFARADLNLAIVMHGVQATKVP